MKQPHIAYLVSEFPAVSHTFIAREIDFLRSQNFTIDVASINQPTSSSTNVFYVKKTAFVSLIPACFFALFYQPMGFFTGLKAALCSGSWDLKLHLYWIFYFFEALIIGHWMHRNDCSHLHVHFANPASSVGLLVAKIFKITFSMTVHGPDEFYDVTRNSISQKIEAAKFVVCISNYARSQLMRLSDPSIWGKFKIAPLGVNPEVYIPSNKVNLIPLILCVGRLTFTKGQHVLLQAFHKVVQKQISAKLIFVGDGPSRSSLKGMVQQLGLDGYVQFKGALNPSQTLEEYKSADIFVLASFAEGVPVVLMEAMSMEIPCIASWINGIPELIQDNLNGLLIPPGDIEALANTLERVILDVKLRKQIGQAARQQILEKYSLEKNTQRLADIFKENT